MLLLSLEFNVVPSLELVHQEVWQCCTFFSESAEYLESPDFAEFLENAEFKFSINFHNKFSIAFVSKEIENPKFHACHECQNE